MASKSKHKSRNPGGKGDAIEAALLVDMFGQSVKTHIELTTKMDVLCSELKENTKATNKLLNHLSGIPACLSDIKSTIRLIKWGLVPVILSLTGVIIFLASIAARR